MNHTTGPIVDTDTKHFSCFEKATPIVPNWLLGASVGGIVASVSFAVYVLCSENHKHQQINNLPASSVPVLEIPK